MGKKNKKKGKLLLFDGEDLPSFETSTNSNEIISSWNTDSSLREPVVPTSENILQRIKSSSEATKIVSMEDIFKEELEKDKPLAVSNLCGNTCPWLVERGQKLDTLEQIAIEQEIEKQKAEEERQQKILIEEQKAIWEQIKKEQK